MATIANLIVKLQADTADVVKGVNQLQTSFANVETMASRVGTALKGMVAGFSVAAAGHELIAFAKDSVDAFAEAELSAKRLGAAITAQGMAASVVRPQYLAFAEALQATTVYEHEAAEAAQTMLIQVGGVLPSQMQRALKATADLAAGMGKDLPDAATAVAKAFAGSTKELSRLMPELKELQKDGLSAAEVMGVIERHFGGQAAAQVETYAGSVKQLGNFWRDVKEEIGGAIAQDAAVQSFLRNMKRGVSDLAEEIKKLGVGGAAKNEIGMGLLSAAPFLGPLAGLFGLGGAGLMASARTKGDIELKPDAAQQAAKVAKEEARIASERMVAQIQRETLALFAHSAEWRTLAEAIRGANQEWDETEKRLKSVADALAWAATEQRAYRQAQGLSGYGAPGSPGYDRASAEAEAKRQYDEKMGRLNEARPYLEATPEGRMRLQEDEAKFWKEYQDALREIYERWLKAQEDATSATRGLTDAVTGLTQTIAPKNAMDITGTYSRAGMGPLGGMSAADLAMYNASLDSMWMAPSARDAWISTKLAGRDMSGLGGGGWALTVNAQNSFFQDPQSLDQLAQIILRAMTQRMASQGYRT